MGGVVTGGAWGAPSTLTAFSFQTSTMFVGSAAETDAAGISAVIATRASALKPASHRRPLEDRGLDRAMTSLL